LIWEVDDNKFSSLAVLEVKIGDIDVFINHKGCSISTVKPIDVIFLIK